MSNGAATVTDGCSANDLIVSSIDPGRRLRIRARRCLEVGAVTKYGLEDISKATISRMATYLRCLTYLEQQGTVIVSSRELASLTGVSPEQVRQDLSVFGRFGKRGTGYDTVRLKTEVEAVFGRGVEQWKCCIVGVGSHPDCRTADSVRT